MPSRRAVLGGLAGVVGGGVGVAVAAGTRLGPFGSWAPAGDTWPLGRRDTASTAAAPDATVPAAPTADWTASVGTGPPGIEGPLVVGPDRVYAGGASLAALDRSSGAVAWRVDRPIRALALRDGRLFGLSARRDTVAAYDASSGERRWVAEVPVQPRGLTVTSGAVVTVARGGTVAHDAGLGRRRWRSDGPDAHRGPPAVVDGRLVVGAHQGVTAFGSRTGLDVPLGRPPPRAWDADVAVANPPVGSPGGAGAVYAATAFTVPQVGRVGLRELDPDTGERRWTAFLPAQTDIDGTGPHVTAPAVADGTGYCIADVDNRPVLAAVSLADGAVRWRRPVRGLAPVRVAGDAVVTVALDERGRRSVVAYDRADGRERWRVPVGASAVEALVPLDGSVFALTDGSVLALR